MKRYRTCTPAVGGGANCPDKQTEISLFQEDEPCAATYCDSRMSHKLDLGFNVLNKHFMKHHGQTGLKCLYLVVR